MKLKHPWSLSLILAIFIPLLANRALAQSAGQQGKSREITSEDFTKERPAKTSTPSTPSAPPTSSTAPRRRRIYRLAKTEPAPVRKRPHSGRPPSEADKTPQVARVKPTTASISEEQIGITLWRLRPSVTEDAGPFIPVIGASGKPEMRTPIRVKADHLFSLGDIVRITVESPRNGYLYVIDRELYPNGALGDAMLIFPTLKTRDGDNRVQAGSLIDIPAWADSTPYFVLGSLHPNYSGELLTFIVSPEPFSDLKIGRNPLPISREQIENWEDEWGTEVYLYEMEGGVGEAQTKVEQQAAQPRTRQLIQGEPVPQTIYRLNVRRGSPFLVNISVKAKTSNK
jgi:hypothetical protein